MHVDLLLTWGMVLTFVFTVSAEKSPLSALLSLAAKENGFKESINLKDGKKQSECTQYCSLFSNVCDNGGSCHPLDACHGECLCKSEYTGRQCESKISNDVKTETKQDSKAETKPENKAYASRLSKELHELRKYITTQLARGVSGSDRR